MSEIFCNNWTLVLCEFEFIAHEPLDSASLHEGHAGWCAEQQAYRLIAVLGLRSKAESSDLQSFNKHHMVDCEAPFLE